MTTRKRYKEILTEITETTTPLGKAIKAIQDATSPEAIKAAVGLFDKNSKKD